MADLLKELQAEQELIEKTLDAVRLTLEKGQYSIIELAALSTFMQNVYNGIENIIKRILKHNEIPIPSTPSFHKDILQTALDNEILNEQLFMEIDEFRAFRHFAIHGYGVILEEDLLRPLAERITGIWKQFYQAAVSKITK